MATLDDLVHHTDSLFTAHITSYPLPPKFRMLTLESYNGAKDLLDNLESFKTLIYLQGVPDEIMCRAFPTTLKGSAQVWFIKIKPNFISTFKEMRNSFVTDFIKGQRHKRSMHALMQIRQREDESLRSYVTRFNKEALLIDEANKMVLVIAFSSGLKEGEFCFLVLKNKPKTMVDILFKATKYMNVEDALIDRKDRKGKRKRDNMKDARSDARKRTSCYEGRKDDRRMKPPSGRIINFTPLNIPLDQVQMQIGDDPLLRCPEKPKGDLSKRSRDKNYCFHRDYGHNTSNC